MLPKCDPTSAVTIPFAKGKERYIAVTFEGLADVGRTAGHQIEDWWAVTGAGAATTTLNGTGMDVVTVTLPVTSNAGFTTAGNVVIDAEKIAYTGKGTGTLTGATRASGSTVATSHSPGSVVTQVP